MCVEEINKQLTRHMQRLSHTSSSITLFLQLFDDNNSSRIVPPVDNSVSVYSTQMAEVTSKLFSFIRRPAQGKDLHIAIPPSRTARERRERS